MTWLNPIIGRQMTTTEKCNCEQALAEKARADKLEKLANSWEETADTWEDLANHWEAVANHFKNEHKAYYNEHEQLKGSILDVTMGERYAVPYTLTEIFESVESLKKRYDHVHEQRNKARAEADKLRTKLDCATNGHYWGLGSVCRLCGASP